MHKEIFHQMVETDSTTHTEQEVQMAEVIIRQIQNHPYFQAHPTQLGLHVIENDPLVRTIPWAIYRASGSSRETILLAGHFDTVSTDNYGPLKQYALTPNTLEAALKKEDGLPSDVKTDLESGMWIFGRGTADMKGGLSVLLNELLRACDENSLNTNLLFLAVPDEETYSAGMRGAVPLLLGLRDTYGLDYKFALMSESHLRGDGSALYYDGTIGKLQINVVVKGAPVHVRYYYTGINPIQIASQIACDVDGNSELSEQVGQEKTPPPSLMYYRDTKTKYDVTLPESVDMAFSFLTYQRTAKQVLEALKDQSVQSVETTMRRHAEQYQQWASSIPSAPAPCRQIPTVLFYEELIALAEEKNSQGFPIFYEQLKADISQQLTDHTISFNDATLKMIHSVLNYFDHSDPMVILAITPPLYSGFTNRDIVPSDSFVLDIPDQLCQFSQKECGQPARFEHYFSGISDLSYIATTYKDTERTFVSKNMPVWGKDYSIDFDGISQLQIPSFNIGPWGKNIHSKFEHVNQNSLFHECPKLLHWLIENF